jgi:hypothetical protein
LVQQSEDGFELALSLDEGVSQFAVTTSPTRVAWPNDFSPEAATTMAYATEDGVLHADVSVHEREILAHSRVTILEVAQQWVSVTQTFDLEIRHGRLPRVEFLIPEGLREHIQPGTSRAAIEFLVDGLEIPYKWPDLDISMVQLDFASRPLRGNVVVEARYKFPWDQSHGDRLSLPVLALPDAETTATECALPGLDITPAIVEGQGWRQVPTAPDVQLWEFAGSTLAVPLELDPLPPAHLARQSVGSAFAAAEFQPDGSYRVSVQYELSQDSRTWSCELPARAQGAQFFLGSEPVETQQATLNGNISYVVRLAPRPAGELLRITYSMPSDGRGGAWGEIHIELPVVAESIWIEELFVEVSFPSGMHLFNSPRGWNQEFAWQRTSWFWTRQPTERLIAARQRLRLKDSQLAPAGIHYGFSRFGATPEISLVWMSRPLIVLLGAGLTLLLGFIMTRVPALRGPLPVLFLGFALSVVGLWYPDPLELLLQPALLGLLLALIASRFGGKKAKRTNGLEPRLELVSQTSSNITPTAKFPIATAKVGGTQSTIYRPLGQIASAGS